MPRLAVVWCPQWSVAAAGCEPTEAVAVVHANRIVARSTAAAAAGVAVGHRRREAQSRCPSLRLIAHEPARDAREFQRVVEAVATIVPRLELTEPGTLTFPTRGPSRYFGGDDAMAQRVLDLVEGAVGDRLGATGCVGIGIADGRFAASVAARRAADARRPFVVACGRSPEFLADLPVRWLHDAGSVDAERVDLFLRLGIRTLGDLGALPATDVLARFGWPGAAAQEMAAGCDDRPPDTEDPPPGLDVVAHFETPVHHLDTVVFTGRRLAEDLVATLGGHGRICTQLVVTAETEHGERCERMWSRSTGLDVGAIVERVRWQLDGWTKSTTDTSKSTTDTSKSTTDTSKSTTDTSNIDVDAVVDAVTAGVTQLRLAPVGVRANEGTQLGLWGGRTQADEWAQRATARLAGLVGDDQVVVPSWRGGRQPDDMYDWVPVALTDLADPSVRLGAGQDAPWPGQLPSPSPASVSTAPVTITVASADGSAVGVSGRGAITAAPAFVERDGRRERVTAWAGPWLLEERWWDSGRRRRVARFQLLTESGRAYLATVERQQWWLVAEYA